MKSLPTYIISYYNACKWLLIALEWDLSISITADRFDPSIGVLLLLLVMSLVAACISYTCITKIFFIPSQIVKLLHFLKCALTLSIFLLIRAVQYLHMTFNLSLSITSTSAHSAAPFLPLPKGILNTKFYCYVSKKCKKLIKLIVCIINNKSFVKRKQWNLKKNRWIAVFLARNVNF